MRVKLLATKRNTGTGICTYCNNIIREIALQTPIDISLINTSELKIFNKPIGGVFKPLIKSQFSLTGNYDIVHSLDLYLIQRNTNIVTLFDIIPLLDTTNYNPKSAQIRIFKYLLNKLQYMDKIITISNYVANTTSKTLNIPRNNFVTAYCGMNHHTFFPSSTVPPEMTHDKINLLFVGELRTRKNVHLILEAIKILGPNYRLIRIGTSNQFYKLKCQQYATNNNIDYLDLGYIPKEQLRDYYSNADTFIFPSSDEGFGIPPMEALACGTKCVISNIPVFKEIYKDKAIFTELNPSHLAKQIKKSLNTNISKSLLIEYAQKFTWKNTAKTIVNTYEELQ